MRPLPIFVIWPKYAIRAISRDFEMANFFARLLPIFVIWPKYSIRAIPRDSETTTLFARPIAHTNISTLPTAPLLQFPRATTSNIHYLA